MRSQACSLAVIGPASAFWLTRASLHSVRSVVSPRFGVVLERRGGRGGLAHEGVSEFSDTALVVGVGGDLWLLLLAFLSVGPGDRRGLARRGQPEGGMGGFGWRAAPLEETHDRPDVLPGGDGLGGELGRARCPRGAGVSGVDRHP